MKSLKEIKVMYRDAVKLVVEKKVRLNNIAFKNNKAVCYFTVKREEKEDIEVQLIIEPDDPESPYPIYYRYFKNTTEIKSFPRGRDYIDKYCLACEFFLMAGELKNIGV